MFKTREQKRVAVITGLSLLVMTIAAIVGTDLTITKLVSPGDPHVTALKIQASENVFRIGIIAWLAILVTDIIASWGLYFLLKPVNQIVAFLMFVFRIVYTSILGVSISNYLNILNLIGHETETISDQVSSQVLLYIKNFDTTWSFGLIIFGMHILLLGYLALKNKTIPKFFGVLFLIGGFGYSVIHTGNILFVDFGNIEKILLWIFIIPMMTEVLFGFWLIVKGLKNGGESFKYKK